MPPSDWDTLKFSPHGQVDEQLQDLPRRRPSVRRLHDFPAPAKPRPAPLIGREAEWASVERFLTHVGDSGGALTVHGELGLGKTALLDEAARAAAGEGFNVVRLRGHPAEAGLAGAGLTQLPAGLAAPADEIFGRCTGDRPVQQPLPGDAFTAAATTMAEALARPASRREPLLLVVDDAHWFDTPSLKALVHACRVLRHSSQRVPVGLLVASRPVPADAGHPPPDLVLRPLDRPAAEQLLRRHTRSLPPHLAGRVLRESEGNPAGLLSIARSLSADPLGDVLLAPRLPLGDPLHQQVCALLSGVSESTRGFLLLTAVARTDRLDRLLQAAAFLDLGACDLEAARARSLLRCDHGTVRFTHPLLRSAVYWDSSSVHRRRAHAALAELPGEETFTHALHWALASAFPDEVTASALEAGAAVELAEAPAVLELAADLSPKPSDRARRLVGAARAAQLRGHMAEVRRLARRLTDVPADPVTAAAVRALNAHLDYHSDCVPAHALDLLLHSAEGPPSPWPPPFLPLASALAPSLGELPGARALRSQLEKLAREDPERGQCPHLTSALVWTCPGPGGAHAERGRALLDAAMSVLEDGRFPRDPSRDAALVMIAIALDDPVAADRLGGPVLEALSCHGHFGTALVVLGHVQIAHQHLADGEAVLRDAETGEYWAHAADDPVAAAVFRTGAAHVRAWEGQEEGHRSLTDDILSFALPRRLHLLAARARWARGLMALSLGKPEEAYEELRLLTQPDGESRHPLVAAWALGDLVAAAVASGHGSDVRDTVRGAAGRHPRSVLVEHLVTRSQAILSDGPEAEGLFTLALSVPQAKAFRYERARTRMAFGEWLRRQRRVREAREQLQRARDAFDSLGAQAWVRRADSELLAAGDASPSPQRVWAGKFGLTPREAEIAWLAVSGLSNQGIGWQLGLTHRTVASHLSHVYVKVGVSSRRHLPSVLEP
ncbi:helix-turn-helix transcriptional regulator [Streptomyces rubrogriseus]|uniref:AAA family ATPase n=1 Tax=Streptomyces rubrogriseus TaxID=194673 RepID=A0A6G3T7Y2_9ACTN|nr:AAA family ATPase [Streptomyces rubrogriseus]